MDKYAYSIKPKDKLLELRLQEVWSFRDLLMLFVHRDFVATYKQTILGPLWFIIQPLFTTMAFTIIFGKIAKISTDGLPPMLFYLAGVTCWSYFSDCFRKTANTFNQNAQIFGKVYFPRLIVPLSVTLTNLISFGIQFLLFIGFLVFFLFKGNAVHPNIYIFLFPFLIFIMGVMGLGFGMMISALSTRYRDLQFLLAFGIQLFMYATPVIYPSSSIPDKYQWIIHVNPMAPIIEAFRFGFLGAGSFSWNAIGYSLLFAAGIFMSGLVIFNRVEKNFLDTV